MDYNKEYAKKVYAGLKKRGYTDADLGDEELFVTRMGREENRRYLYDLVTDRGDANIGSWERFNTRMTERPTEEPDGVIQYLENLSGIPYPQKKVDKSQYTFTSSQLGIEEPKPVVSGKGVRGLDLSGIERPYTQPQRGAIDEAVENVEKFHRMRYGDGGTLVSPGVYKDGDVYRTAGGTAKKLTNANYKAYKAQVESDITDMMALYEQIGATPYGRLDTSEWGKYVDAMELGGEGRSRGARRKQEWQNRMRESYFLPARELPAEKSITKPQGYSAALRLLPILSLPEEEGKKILGEEGYNALKFFKAQNERFAQFNNEAEEDAARLGFAETMAQGFESMGRGAEYFLGESYNAFSGSALDDKAIIDNWDEFFTEDGKLKSAPQMGFAGTNEIENRNINLKAGYPEVYKDYRDYIQGLLAENGNDIDKVKKIIKERSKDATFGDRLIIDADNAMNSFNPEMEGALGLVAKTAPQMVGVLAAIVSGGAGAPLLGSAIGIGNMGYLTASTMGQSMKEARDAGATNLETWLTGIADGAIELVTEKIPFDNWTKGILRTGKGKIAGELVESMTKNPAAREEFELLLKRSRKDLDIPAFSGNNIKKYLAGVAAEGASEFTAEALQTLTKRIYENPEDYPTIMEAIKNGWEGAKAGLLMGAVTGAVVTSQQRRANDARRKKQGFVEVASLEIDGKPYIGEIVGETDAGDWVVNINGEDKVVRNSNIKDKVVFSYEEFRTGEIMHERQMAFDEGYSQEPTGEAAVNNIGALEAAENEVRRMLGLANDTDIDAEVAKFELTDEEAEAVDNYRKAKARFEGTQQRFQETRDAQYAESDRRIDERSNKRNPAMVYSTMYDGQQVYITDGDVVLNEDGTIDYNNSSEALYITYPDGHVEQVSVSKFIEKVNARDTEELKAQERAQIDQNWKNEFDTAEISAAEQEKRKKGLLFNLTDGVGDHTIEVLEEGADDSKILFDGKEMPISTDELNQWRQEAGVQREVAPVQSSAPAVAPIPIEKRGKEERAAYHLAPIERTLEDLHDGALEPNEITALINARIKEAYNDVQALEKKKPTEPKKPVMGASKEAYLIAKAQVKADFEKAQAEWQTSMDEAQQRLNYYNELYAREQEITKSETREAYDNVQPREVVEMTADEFIANNLPKITPESFKAETGLSNSEQAELVGYIAGADKGGVSVERAAEIIMESYGDELRGLGFQGDMQDVRDIIIDILSQGNPRSYAKSGIEQRRKDSINQQRAEMESVAASLGFESVEEWAAYEEQVIPGIIQMYTGFDYNEYYNNLAENYEYDTTREGKTVGRGGELLQGEQPVDNTGAPVAEGNEGGAVPDSVQSDGANAQASGNQQVNEPVGNSEQLSSSEIPNNQSVAGLEGYSTSEILDLVKGHIFEALGENVRIVDMRIIGSRTNGTNNADSDLDVLVEYEGDISEDSFFNAVNDGEGALYIDGIRVDINPITKDKSGSIEQWMNRNKGYSKAEGDAPGQSGVEEITNDERVEMEARIVDWLSEDNLERASGKTRDEIFDEFGNELEPIAYIPTQYISLVSQDLKDQRIYCGKGYFIDHALRNHAKGGKQLNAEDVDVSKYLNIQSVLDNPDSVKETYVDGKRTVVFIKKIGRYFAELTQVEEDGKIVLHKSMFDQKKEPYAKLDDIRSKGTSSEGGVSSISHTAEAAPAISLESRGDVVSNSTESSASEDRNSVSNKQENTQKSGENAENGGENAVPEWLNKVPDDGRNFFVYVKFAGENKYQAIDLGKGETVDRLVRATMLQKEQLQALVDKLPSVLLEDAEFQIRDAKGNIYYNSGKVAAENEPIKDEAPVTSEPTEQPETGEVANAGPVNMDTLQLNMSDEDFNALLNSGDKAAISEYLAEMDGLLRVGVGSPLDGQEALRKEYRKAVEQYGKENIPAEVMDDLNSRMQPYSDLSRAVFDRKYALQDRLREIEATEQRAKELAEKEAKAEHKQTAFGGFLAGKTDLGASAAEKALNKKYDFDGKVMTVAEFVEEAVGNGDAKLSTIEEPKYNGASRAAWNRMDARQQEADAKRVKESGTKTVYTVNDHDLGKTAYDYAKFLLNKKAEQEKAAAKQMVKNLIQPFAKEKSEEIDEGIMFRTTYHGSGAKFDKFDHSFMGSGEGAQAYGWGTYVTEVEGIGRTYAGVGVTKLGSLQAKLGNIDSAISSLEKEVQRAEKDLTSDNETARHIAAYALETASERRKALEEEKAAVEEEIKSYRNLYTVDIPEDNGSNYLHWDERINGEIQERVANGLQNIGFEIEPGMNHLAYSRDGKIAVLNINAKGKDLYAELSEVVGGDKAASLFLNNLGFVGISYPANATTGGRADGARNYVIFNEDDAVIEEHVMFRMSKTPQEFDLMQKAAVEKRGIVSSGLNNTAVNVVDVPRHDFVGSLKEARTKAKEWAVENYTGKEFDLPDNAGKYVISKNAIGKYLDKSAFDKSENATVHLSVLKELPNVISNSIEVEIHADYLKGENGERNAENGVNRNDLLVHRIYGAVNIDGNTYRVKTTIHEFRDANTANTPHSYEVTKIELIEDSTVTPNDGIDNPLNRSVNSISATKLLEGVEKSYDKGKKVLDESENLTREGAGPLTDREVVMESDLYSKVLGKPRYYGKRQREFVARQRRRMAEKARQVAEKLNLDNVEVLESTEGLTGKKATSKGWFDPRTGKITVVVPNHGSVGDVVETVLHEGVAHYGLRKLFGDAFDTFLDNIFNNVDAETRAKIVELSKKYNENPRTATEEYLASLAEETNFEKVNPTLWERIKAGFMQLLANVGIKLDFELSDNELRYILWRSYQNLVAPDMYNNVFAIAENIAKQYELGVGDYAPTVQGNTEAAENETRFRTTGETIENQKVAEGASEETMFRELTYDETVQEAKNFEETHKGSAPIIVLDGIDNWESEFIKAGVKKDEIERFRERLKTSSGNPKAAYLDDADLIFIFSPKVTRKEFNGYIWHENMHKAIREDDRFNRDIAERIINTVVPDGYQEAIEYLNKHGYEGLAADEEALCQILQSLYLEGAVGKNGFKGRGVIQDFFNPLIKKIYGRERRNPNLGNREVQAATQKADREELSGRSLATTADRKTGRDSETETQSTGEESEIRFRVTETEIARNTAIAVGEKLNTPVSVIEDSSALPENRRDKKGWFDPKTGEVAVVMGNHISTEDVVETVLHEVVGHKGLRAVMGEKFDEFLDGVYRNGSSRVKRGITDVFYGAIKGGHALTMREATEEYVAGLAERDFEGFEDTWNAIKQWFRDFFRNFMNMEVTDGELRYMLWKNYNRMKSGPIEMIIDRAMEARTDTGDKGTMFRRASTGGIGERYDRRVEGKWNKFKEGWYDATRSIGVAQEEIERESGKEISDSANIYDYANHIPSINRNKMERFDIDYIQPFLNFLKAVRNRTLNSGEKLDEQVLGRYANAKHGLERNREMSVRKALTEVVDGERKFNQEAYDQYRQEVAAIRNNRKAWLEQQDELDALAATYGATIKDYSGLTAIFGTEQKRKYSDIRKAAVDMVLEVEGEINSKKFWEHVNGINGYSLKESFESGLLSKKDYDNISDMYQYYVPLRGHKDTMAEDVYEYIEEKKSNLNGVVKTAHGRTSEAEDIFATMLNMANSAIVFGSKNRLKQRLLNLTLMNRTPLLSVGEAWYSKVGEEYVPMYPNINEKMTAEEIAAEHASFEERMKELEKQGLAMKHRQGVNLRYAPEGSWAKNQHAVSVKRNGKEYIVYVNASPKLAQAVNGLLLEDDGNWFLNSIDRVNSWRAKTVTGYSPSFVARNLVRDFQSSSVVYSALYGAAAMVKFDANVTTLIPRMHYLYALYKKNRLDMSNATHRYFKEFLENGGETGYTEMISIEEYQRKIKKYAQGASIGDYSKAPIKAAAELVEFANRGVENVCRFAAYMTSREAGMSILKSVNDAKEVSVNFNRKGSGAYGQATAKRLYMFLNPAIQAMVQRIELTKRYPKRMAAVYATEFAMGAAMPALFALLYSLLGGDDDEAWGNYYNLTNYKRRSNICLPLGDGCVTIPLAHESRVAFGLGELITSAIMGHTEYDNVGVELFNTLTQSLPINPVEGMTPGDNVFETIGLNVAPDAVKPFVEILVNKDFAGNTIHNASDFNKHYPEHERGKRGAGTLYTLLSEALSGEYERNGWDDTLGRVITPSSLEHLAKSYLGGLYTTANEIVKSVQWAAGNEEFAEFRNIPIANGFYTSTEKYESKPSAERTRRDWEKAYKFYAEEVSLDDGTEKNYRRHIKEGDAVAEDRYNLMVERGEALRVDIFNDGRDVLSKLYDEMDVAREAKNFKRVEELDKLIYNQKRFVVERMEQLRDDPMSGYLMLRMKTDDAYGVRETYGDKRDMDIINDFQTELKPILDNYPDGRASVEYGERYSKELNLLGALKKIERAVSQYKSDMKKNDNYADEYMTEIRKLRAEAIELINRYYNE